MTHETHRPRPTTAAATRPMPDFATLFATYRKSSRGQIASRATGRNAACRTSPDHPIAYLPLGDRFVSVDTAIAALEAGRWLPGARSWPIATAIEPLRTALWDEKRNQRVAAEIEGSTADAHA